MDLYLYQPFLAPYVEAVLQLSYKAECQFLSPGTS